MVPRVGFREEEEVGDLGRRRWRILGAGGFGEEEEG
jgi:hypothetical protein